MKDAILALIDRHIKMSSISEIEKDKELRGFQDGWLSAMLNMKESIEKMEVSDPRVSVEEDLPEAGKEVLIFTNGQEKEQVVGFITEDGRWLMELGYNYDEPAGPNNYPVPQAETFKVVNVTGWMPLPQPPKAKQ